ncbi:MAG: Pr6Pr family membrane protein [Maricaulaceae bacterium]
MKTQFRVISACVTWASIILQYLVLLQVSALGGVMKITLTYLSYFTVVTNIFVGLAFTAPFLKTESRLRKIFIRPAVRAAITLYITIVMIVYWTVLAAIHETNGLGALANYGLHLIVPLLFLIDWFVFTPKRNLRFSDLPLWVVYPLLYGVYTLLRGQVTGTYPYPFLDLSVLGWRHVLLNMCGFVMVYLIGGAVFITLGRKLPKGATTI